VAAGALVIGDDVAGDELAQGVEHGFREGDRFVDLTGHA
jgi:hypothetical protein